MQRMSERLTFPQTVPPTSDHPDSLYDRPVPADGAAPPEPPRPFQELVDEARRHRLYQQQKTFFIACLIVIGGSFLLTPAPPHGACVSVFGMNLPSSCPSMLFFHNPCPGCGMTRSFVSCAHGRFSESLQHHRVGPFFFLFVFGQIPYRLFLLWLGPDHVPAWNNALVNVFPPLFLVAILANWVFLMMGM